MLKYQTKNLNSLPANLNNEEKTNRKFRYFEQYKLVFSIKRSLNTKFTLKIRPIFINIVKANLE